MVACCFLLRVKCGFDEAADVYDREAELLNKNSPFYEITADNVRAEDKDFLREQKQWIEEMQGAELGLMTMWLDYGVFSGFQEKIVFQESDLERLGPLGLFREVCEWVEKNVPYSDSQVGGS